MTTQRRGRRSQRTPRARTSRRVWANSTIATSLTVDAIQIIDMLAIADDFMLFDSTILSVLMTDLFVSFDAAAVLETRQFQIALLTGKNTLDSDDFLSLFASNIGPPYMWRTGKQARLAASVQAVTVDFTEGAHEIRIKAKRRFTENDETLWFVVQNNMNAGDSNVVLSGTCRVLLHIP